MSKPKLSFSLKGAAAAPATPGGAKPRAFSTDDEPDAPPPGTRSVAPVSKRVRRQQAEAEKIDESLFDYDGVYDKMKEAERQVRAAHKEEDKKRKPKYMSQFFAAAETRERDRLRAEAKMIQRERAAEGAEFADKEAFVTSAYKQQQEELQRAEAEEQLREARERAKSKGVASFHQRMLDEESRRRQAAVEAVDKASSEPVQTTSDDTDKARAARAAEKGLHVELNDDQQIVDQRDLLKRGLNVMRKRKEPEPELDTERAPPSSSRVQRSQLMEEELLARLGDSDDEAL